GKGACECGLGWRRPLDRDYPANSLERVRLIQSALNVGFSLPELATIWRRVSVLIPTRRDSSPDCTVFTFEEEHKPRNRFQSQAQRPKPSRQPNRPRI